MGSALRLHPLLVIFGLLVGFEVDGLVGALIALPLLAACNATWGFFSERLVFESWTRRHVAVPVESRAGARGTRPETEAADRGLRPAARTAFAQ